MGRKRTHVPLDVFLNARKVGQLTRKKTGAVDFIYDMDWLSWEHALPVSISMPLREDQFTGEQVTAVFDNLLPDYEPIRRRVAECVGASGTDSFSLLSEIGRDCVGALQFLPDGEVPHPTNKLTGKTLSDTDIENILNNLDVTPLGIRGDNNFRISVAGAQEKTALLRHNKQWIEPAGTTPTSHIIKPQIGKLQKGLDLSNSVENEYFCLNLMQQFGLKTATVEIATFNKRKALLIERFDRRWTKDGRLIRLPQEDCCQALSVPPTLKYQNDGGPGVLEIMDILRGSDEPNEDRHDFFKAQILFWLIGATDGHVKNFSLALSSQGRFRMTPLYDVLTVQPSIDNKQLTLKNFKLAMRMGHSNQYNVERILGRHFLDTGRQSGLSKVAIVNLFEEVADTADSAIQATIDALPNNFPDELADSIKSAIQHRLPRLSMS